MEGTISSNSEQYVKDEAFKDGDDERSQQTVSLCVHAHVHLRQSDLLCPLFSGRLPYISEVNVSRQGLCGAAGASQTGACTRRPAVCVSVCEAVSLCE